MFRKLEKKLLFLMSASFTLGLLFGYIIRKSVWWIIPLAIAAYFLNIEYKHVINQLEVMTKDFFKKINTNN